MLSVARNQLTALPPELGELLALTVLNLWGNQLTALPPELARLTALTELSVSSNQLTALPPELGGLTALTYLDVSQNQLTALPPELGELTGLTHLHVSHNQLMGLPPELGRLTGLTELYACNNWLTALPSELGELTALTRLDVSENLLTALPSELGQLSTLTALDVSGNPLPADLLQLAKRGDGELLEYLRRTLEEGTPLYESKLLFVGNGGVGKTCLLHALQRKEPKRDEPTTYGIEIAREPLWVDHPDRPGQRITLNCWDFGGQEVYRITHQFFFSQNALYLVLWDPRHGIEKCDVEGWLNLIRLRVGPTARVIVVATHVLTENRVVRIDEKDLTRKFGDILVGFHEVDSFVVSRDRKGDKHGVAELRDWIAHEAAELDGVDRAFPKSWRDARDALLSLARGTPGPEASPEGTSPEGRAWVTFEEFADVCGRSKLSPNNARMLALLLNWQGHIVHFDPPPAAQSGSADQGDERLRDVVVLQPEWLGKAIGFVLEDKPTNDASGVLKHERLADIWWHRSEPRYEPKLHPYLLRLMEKYDVSYRFEDGKSSLVPQLIKENRPESLPWRTRGGEELAPLMQVCDFYAVPTGLIPLLIVRSHGYQGAKGLHWTRGMFLDYADYGDARIELEGRELVFEVRAGYPQHFMSILTGVLERLLGDVWPGLQKGAPDGYTLKVPCYAHNRQGGPCGGRHDLGALRDFEKQATRVSCPACRTFVDIGRLLRGFPMPGVNLQERLEEILNELRAQRKLTESLLARLAEMYLDLLRAMSSERREAPGLFTLLPEGGGPASEKLRLTLWCEWPEGPHPCCPIGSTGPKGDPQRGEYVFQRPKDWLVKAAPTISWTVKILKVAVPMAGRIVETGFGEMLPEDIDAKIKLMEQMAAALPAGDLEIDEHPRLRGGLSRRLEDAELRSFGEWLRELDARKRWGALTKTLIPTRDFFWMCPKHHRIYEPDMPVL